MIGVDLVYIPEFNKQLKLGGDNFLNKAFNTQELADKKTEHLAGIWAAKEAIVKVLDMAPKNMKEIIVSEKNGKPVGTLGEVKFEVSISHHGEYAIAVALKVR